MTVIGIVGLPGSGKSEAANVARELGIPVVTMGDVVRQETADRGLDPASDHGAVAQALREEEGRDAIAKRSLPILEDHLADGPAVVVDGIRSGDEVARFEEAFGEDFLLVEITAPRELRAERRGGR
jgi:dephospho-CoA kinase